MYLSIIELVQFGSGNNLTKVKFMSAEFRAVVTILNKIHQIIGYKC